MEQLVEAHASRGTVKEKEVRRNLRRLQLFKVLAAANLLTAVRVPFYQENGLNQTQIYASLGAMALSCLLMEVPSGYFADRYGRRSSLVFGAIVLTVAFVVLSQSYGLPMILLGDVIIGIGGSFISGANTAMAYDLLKSIGREKEEGQQFEVIGMACYAAGALLSALLGTGVATHYGIRASVWLQIPILLFLVVVALRLREPKEATSRSLISNRERLGLLWQILRRGRELRLILFYSAVIMTAISVIIWLRAPFYQQAGISMEWFGLLLGADVIGMAVFAQLAKYLTRWGYGKAFWTFNIVLITSYAVLAMFSAGWWAVMFVGPLAVLGMCHPVFTNYVNRLTESKVRATVLSIQSMVSNLFFVGTSWLVGWVADSYSLSAAFGFSAVVFGTLGAGILVVMGRAKLF